MQTPRNQQVSDPDEYLAYLTSLASQQVEQQLLDGTCPAAVIVQLFKMTSKKNELEELKLRSEVALAEAKVDSIKSNAESATKYQEVIDAIKSYMPSQ